MDNSIRLRKATLDDCRTLFNWRNDQVTVAMSLVSEPVPWESHVAWFENSLVNPKRHLLVAEQDGNPVGTIRFDDLDDTSEISITVSPDQRGKGMGTSLLDAADEWAREELGLDRIIARIKESNPASIAIFKKSGYEITETGEVLSLVKYL